jgi:hypothetical protein
MLLSVRVCCVDLWLPKYRRLLSRRAPLCEAHIVLTGAYSPLKRFLSGTQFIINAYFLATQSDRHMLFLTRAYGMARSLFHYVRYALLCRKNRWRRCVGGSRQHVSMSSHRVSMVKYVVLYSRKIMWPTCDHHNIMSGMGSYNQHVVIRECLLLPFLGQFPNDDLSNELQVHDSWEQLGHEISIQINVLSANHFIMSNMCVHVYVLHSHCPWMLLLR